VVFGLGPVLELPLHPPHMSSPPMRPLTRHTLARAVQNPIRLKSGSNVMCSQRSPLGETFASPRYYEPWPAILDPREAVRRRWVIVSRPPDWERPVAADEGLIAAAEGIRANGSRPPDRPEASPCASRDWPH